LVARGITRLNQAATEYRAAIDMIKAGLRQAEKGSKGSDEAGLLPLQSIANMALAIAFNRQGEFREALAHAEKAIATYDPAYQPPSVDSRVFAIAEHANSLFFLGFLDQARARALEAADLADKMANAPSFVYALARGATVFGLCREHDKALTMVDRLIAFSADKDLPTMRAWAYFLRGTNRAAAGNPDEGCRIMRPAIAELDSPAERGRAGSTAHARALLCFCEVEAGILRPHEAIARMNSIVEESMQTGADGLLPETYRMMGLVRLGEEKNDLKGPLDAEKFFQKAIDLAHAHSNRPFELRSAIELARLWRRQAKGPQARKMLAAIYRRFSEGHDTADLKDAKALIEELQTSSNA
jgi:adenylate cyclase